MLQTRGVSYLCRTAQSFTVPRPLAVHVDDYTIFVVTEQLRLLQIAPDTLECVNVLQLPSTIGACNVRMHCRYWLLDVVLMAADVTEAWVVDFDDDGYACGARLVWRMDGLVSAVRFKSGRIRLVANKWDERGCIKHVSVVNSNGYVSLAKKRGRLDRTIAAAVWDSPGSDFWWSAKTRSSQLRRVRIKTRTERLWVDFRDPVTALHCSGPDTLLVVMGQFCTEIAVSTDTTLRSTKVSTAMSWWMRSFCWGGCVWPCGDDAVLIAEDAGNSVIFTKHRWKFDSKTD